MGRRKKYDSNADRQRAYRLHRNEKSVTLLLLELFSSLPLESRPAVFEAIKDEFYRPYRDGTIK